MELSSTLCLPCVLQTVMSETGPNRASLSIHSFPQFSFSSRGNVYFLGKKIDSSLHSVTEEHRRIVHLDQIQTCFGAQFG